MVTLSSFRRWLGVGGRNVDVELTAWEARWLDAQQLFGENIGDTDSWATSLSSKAPARREHHLAMGRLSGRSRGDDPDAPPAGGGGVIRSSRTR